MKNKEEQRLSKALSSAAAISCSLSKWSKVAHSLVVGDIYTRNNLLDRYEYKIEFLREGNVKGPLGIDSRTGFAWLLASRALSNKLTITFYWEVQMTNRFLDVKLDSRAFQQYMPCTTKHCWLVQFCTASCTNILSWQTIDLLSSLY